MRTKIIWHSWLKKKVPVGVIDEAVKRILKKKFELGLFDDPYKFSNAQREQKELNDPEHKKFAREIAKKVLYY